MIQRPPTSTLFPYTRSSDLTGKIIADAGTIAMHAQVVNQNGLVQANSVRQRNGVIELVATEELNLGSESDRKSTRLNSSHMSISYAVFCLKKKKKKRESKHE